MIFAVSLLALSLPTNSFAAEGSSYRLMEVSYDEKYIYVADSGTNELVVIDLQTETVFKRIAVGKDPRDVTVLDGPNFIGNEKILVTNFFDNTVSVIDKNTLIVTKTIMPPEIGHLPWGIDFTNDVVVVANWGGNGLGVPPAEQGSISVLNITTNFDTPSTCGTKPIESAPNGGPWGVKASGIWVVITNDGLSRITILNTVTCKIIDLNVAPCILPWDLEITDDGEIIIACGAEDFFPRWSLECLGEGASIDECKLQSLSYPPEWTISAEPWAVESNSESGLIVAANMDNEATSGSEQTRGSVLVWDYDTLELKKVITDGVSAPREALALDNGDIVISNSGTHEISNKQLLLEGTPFDYSKAEGANISILKADGEMIVVPLTDDPPTCPPGQELVNGKCVPITCPEGQELVDGVCCGGCMTACAFAGSELAPLVQELRETRDNVVLTTNSGSSFMNSFLALYYTFSPTIADWERDSPEFREAVKIAITPMLLSLSLLNHVDIDSEEEMLGYGIGVILLNIGMYIAAPVVAVTMIVNKVSKRNN